MPKLATFKLQTLRYSSLIRGLYFVRCTQVLESLLLYLYYLYCTYCVLHRLLFIPCQLVFGIHLLHLRYSSVLVRVLSLQESWSPSGRRWRPKAIQLRQRLTCSLVHAALTLSNGCSRGTTLVCIVVRHPICRASSNPTCLVCLTLTRIPFAASGNAVPSRIAGLIMAGHPLRRVEESKQAGTLQGGKASASSSPTLRSGSTSIERCT
jgi:hypothetical protein